MNNYTAMDVANYIIWFVNNVLRRNNLTPLKLQKILYYVQVFYLINNQSRPLFLDSIQKWQYGPVVPSVYFEFKDNGVSHISESKSTFSFQMSPNGGFNFDFSPFDPSRIHNDPSARRAIEEVTMSLIDRDPFQLVHKTHLETVWLKDQSRILMGEKGIEYTIEELVNYFKLHGDFLRS